MPGPLVLALDQGTTSSRALVVDRDAQVRGFAANAFAQHFPQPGWVEHDPADILASQLDAARRALRAANATARDLAAIGITNQRETTLLWERATGRPLANAVVWQDRRTAERCDELRARGVDELVRARTGLVLDPYFSATKIAWLLDSIAGARTRAERGELAFGTIDSWLIWNLTDGRHLTDATNAARTMLFDVDRRVWDDDLLRAFDVPRAILPEVVPCIADFGTTSRFGSRVAIAGVAGDQHAALFGQACFEPGLAKNTYGTGSFVVLNTGARRIAPRDGVLATIGYALARDQVTYALEGSIFSTGATVQWLRDGLGMLAEAADIEALARSVPDSDGVVFVPAFGGLGAPYWDPYARGTIVGITRGTTRAHLARAALDAMAWQTADVVAAMERCAGLALAELRVDGGAAANDFAMQLQADALGCAVVRPANVEATALGAAYLAGLGCGLWAGVDELRSLRRTETRFEPAGDPARRARDRERWHRAVARSRDWARP